MLPIIKEKWNEILELMKIENDIAEVAFTTWVIHFKPYKVEGNMLTVSVEKENLVLDANWFSKKFRMPLIISIAEVLETEFDVRFIIPDGTEEDSDIEEESKADSSEVNTHLNPRYTFDTFVVGKNNDIAHATALAVAEDPGTYGNPLFIYGGAGLGKTHLLHSMAHYVLSKHPDYRIIYVTSEEFTNELVRSIQHKQGESFKNKYRNIDMLLIDDIQFIVNKESTQEEFFHTFNALQTQGKQIILTSDKPPKEMETLEERIRSRFEWGLMADIGVPDYETRMAILRKKAESDNFNIDDDILNYIATNIKSNVRELEGALNKLLAFNHLEHTDITMEIAERELANIITPDKPREITPQLIVEVVSEHFHISVDQMISKNRSSDIAKPRQIAMYLCKNMTSSPLDAIGALLGGRDHSTIIHGIKKVTEEYEGNETTRALIETIKKKINPN